MSCKHIDLTFDRVIYTKLPQIQIDGEEKFTTAKCRGYTLTVRKDTHGVTFVGFKGISDTICLFVPKWLEEHMPGTIRIYALAYACPIITYSGEFDAHNFAMTFFLGFACGQSDTITAFKKSTRVFEGLYE